MKLSNSEKIIEIIKKNISLFASFDEVYLFGSILKNNKAPNDIDILLIYTKRSNKILNDLNTIVCYLTKQCVLPIDLTALSSEEEKDTNFLTKINSYLKIK